MNLINALREVLRKEMTDGIACAQRHPLSSATWQGDPLGGGTFVFIACSGGEYVEKVRVPHDAIVDLKPDDQAAHIVSMVQFALTAAELRGDLRRYVLSKPKEAPVEEIVRGERVKTLGEVADEDDATVRRFKNLEIE